MSAPTRTCPAWCTDHDTWDGYGGPGVDSNTHHGVQSTQTGSHGDTVDAALYQFQIGDKPAGPVEVQVAGDAHLTPAQARAFAAELLRLADLAEASA